MSKKHWLYEYLEERRSWQFAEHTDYFEKTVDAILDTIKSRIESCKIESYYTYDSVIDDEIRYGYELAVKQIEESLLEKKTDDR